MSTIYRPLQADEVPASVEVHLEAFADLCRRHNLAVPPPDHEAELRDYAYGQETGVFWGVERDGQLDGVCLAMVRERLWFLSGFWVRPAAQGRGIGKPLLERVWAEGQRAGCDTYFVWSSIDFPAVATYLRLGMLPGTQLMSFAGPVGRPPSAGGCTLQPLTLAQAAEFDAVYRSTTREIDHRHWLSRSDYRGWAVMRNGEPAGYFYLHGQRIGPAAWHSAHPEVMASALAKAAENGGEVRITIPGTNHAALRSVLEARLKLVNSSHLLMTRPFATFDSYIPSGPLLF